MALSISTMATQAEKGILPGTQDNVSDSNDSDVAGLEKDPAALRARRKYVTSSFIQ